jgi:hypothetical protein
MKMPKFMLKTEVCGNPDYGQDPNSPPYGVNIVRITTNSIEVLIERVRHWQGENDIGGGNWMNPAVYVDGKEVGYMSYNGKVWADRSWTPNTKQINLTEENHE